MPSVDQFTSVWQVCVKMVSDQSWSPLMQFIHKNRAVWHMDHQTERHRMSGFRHAEFCIKDVHLYNRSRDTASHLTSSSIAGSSSVARCGELGDLHDHTLTHVFFLIQMINAQFPTKRATSTWNIRVRLRSGEQNMDSAFVVQRESALRHDRLFRQLHTTWSAVRKDHQGFMSKEVHEIIFTRFFEIFAFDISDSQQRQSLVERDWRIRADGRVALDGERFIATMAATCDAWCETPDVEEMIEFAEHFLSIVLEVQRRSAAMTMGDGRDVRQKGHRAVVANAVLLSLGKKNLSLEPLQRQILEKRPSNIQLNTKVRVGDESTLDDSFANFSTSSDGPLAGGTDDIFGEDHLAVLSFLEKVEAANRPPETTGYDSLEREWAEDRRLSVAVLDRRASRKGSQAKNCAPRRGSSMFGPLAAAVALEGSSKEAENRLDVPVAVHPAQFATKSLVSFVIALTVGQVPHFSPRSVRTPIVSTTVEPLDSEIPLADLAAPGPAVNVAPTRRAVVGRRGADAIIVPPMIAGRSGAGSRRRGVPGESMRSSNDDAQEEEEDYVSDESVDEAVALADACLASAKSSVLPPPVGGGDAEAAMDSSSPGGLQDHRPGGPGIATPGGLPRTTRTSSSGIHTPQKEEESRALFLSAPAVESPPRGGSARRNRSRSVVVTDSFTPGWSSFQDIDAEPPPPSAIPSQEEVGDVTASDSSRPSSFFAAVRVNSAAFSSAAFFESSARLDADDGINAEKAGNGGGSGRGGDEVRARRRSSVRRALSMSNKWDFVAAMKHVSADRSRSREEAETAASLALREEELFFAYHPLATLRCPLGLARALSRYRGTMYTSSNDMYGDWFAPRCFGKISVVTLKEQRLFANRFLVEPPAAAGGSSDQRVRGYVQLQWYADPASTRVGERLDTAAAQSWLPLASDLCEFLSQQWARGHDGVVELSGPHLTTRDAADPSMEASTSIPLELSMAGDGRGMSFSLSASEKDKKGCSGRYGRSLKHQAAAPLQYVDMLTLRLSSAPPVEIDGRPTIICGHRLCAKYDYLWEFGNQTNTFWAAFPEAVQTKLQSWLGQVKEYDRAQFAKLTNATHVPGYTPAASLRRSVVSSLRSRSSQTTTRDPMYDLSFDETLPELQHFTSHTVSLCDPAMTLISWRGSKSVVLPLRYSTIFINEDHNVEALRVTDDWLPTPIIRRKLFEGAKSGSVVAGNITGAARVLEPFQRTCIIPESVVKYVASKPVTINTSDEEDDDDSLREVVAKTAPVPSAVRAHLSVAFGALSALTSTSDMSKSEMPLMEVPSNDEDPELQTPRSPLKLTVSAEFHPSLISELHPPLLDVNNLPAHSTRSMAKGPAVSHKSQRETVPHHHHHHHHPHSFDSFSALDAGGLEGPAACINVSAPSSNSFVADLRRRTERILSGSAQVGECGRSHTRAASAASMRPASGGCFKPRQLPPGRVGGGMSTAPCKSKFSLANFSQEILQAVASCAQDSQLLAPNSQAVEARDKEKGEPRAKQGGRSEGTRNHLESASLRFVARWHALSSHQQQQQQRHKHHLRPTPSPEPAAVRLGRDDVIPVSPSRCDHARVAPLDGNCVGRIAVRHRPATTATARIL